jgi:NADH:ubiquinone oxidoreductase subunit H
LYWFIFLYSPAASAFVLLLLLESKRTPFDHAETESEVVAGYSVEYSGPMLLMFYLCEYLHLIISSVHFVLFFMGGWFSLKFFFFLPPIFLVPNDSNYFLELFINLLWN